MGGYPTKVSKSNVKQFYLFESIGRDIDKETFKVDLEHTFGQKPFQVYYGTNPSKAVAVFRSTIGQVRTSDKGLRAKKVYEPQTLQVLPKPNETFEERQMNFYQQYFSSSKDSGGGDCKIVIQKDYLLVTYNNVKDARSVCKHMHAVEVLPYFEELQEESALSNPMDVAKLWYLQRKKEKDTKDHMMKTAEASLDWPDFESSTWGFCSVVLKPTFKLNSDAGYKKLLTWRTKAVDALDKWVKPVMKEIFQIQEEKWNEVHVALTNFQSQNRDILVLEEDKENRVTLLTMTRELLHHAKKQVDEICNTRDDTVEKQEIFGNREKFEAFKKLGFMETFKDKFRNTKFQCSNDLVIIKGPKTEVDEAIIEIRKSFSDLKNVKKQIDWKKAKLLSDEGVRDKIDEIVRQKALEIISWHLEGNENVVIYARNEKGFSGIEILLSCIKELLVEEVIDLDNEDVRVVSEDTEWKSLLDELLKRNMQAHVTVNTAVERSVIELTGFTDAVRNAKEKISTFLQKQRKDKLLVHMSNLTTEFISKHRHNMITNTLKTKVDVYQGSDNKPGGFVILGTSDQRKQGENNLRTLEANVCTIWFYVQQPKLVKTPIPQQKSMWENQCQCIISIETAFTLAKSSNPCVAISQDGKMIQLILGDITDLKVDVIVNPANKDLNHSDGLARVIIDKGGKEIQDNCNEFVKTNGPLDVREVYVTGGGRLQCKHIIHAVGPVWQNGKNNEEKKLYDTVQNILHEAEKLNSKSVAIPYVSMGVFAFPPDKGTQQMLQAIQDFITQLQKKWSSSIEQIFLCNLTEDIFHLCDAMEKVLRSSWFVLQHNLPLSQDKIKAETAYVKDEKRGPTISSGGKSAASPAKNTIQSPLADDVIVVGITSDAKENISEVKTKMITSIGEAYTKDTFTLKINLTAELEKKIQEFAEEAYVRVKTDSMKNEVEIHGFGVYVGKTKMKIDQLAADLEMRERAAKMYSILANIIDWEEEIATDKWTPFSSEINVTLETNFRNKPNGQFVYEANQDRFTFNLANKTKFNQMTRQNTNIRRNDKTHGIQLPHMWDITKTGEEFKEVQLSSGSTEYNNVKTTFRTGGCSFTSINQIIRVENRTLYLQYQLKKQDLERRNSKEVENERILFHGTTMDTITKINQGGYDRNYCGKNAVAYGDGVYFATTSRYSHTYAKQDANGMRHMYVARVLTGQFTKGAKEMKAAPRNPAFSENNVMFDSVVDKIPDQSMYIIFHDSQAYPEYLVEYK